MFSELLHILWQFFYSPTLIDSLAKYRIQDENHSFKKLKTLLYHLWHAVNKSLSISLRISMLFWLSSVCRWNAQDVFPLRAFRKFSSVRFHTKFFVSFFVVQWARHLFGPLPLCVSECVWVSECVRVCVCVCLKLLLASWIDSWI